MNLNKHIDLLLESYAILKKKINCQLELVIPKITDNHINQWFSHLRKKIPVKVLTGLKPNEIANRYRHADLTLLISAKDNFPLVYLESIACATPMLISEIKDLLPYQDKISPQLIIKKLDKQTIAKAILAYYSLKETEKRKIKDNCLGVAKNFSWEKSAKILNYSLNAYHSI